MLMTQHWAYVWHLLHCKWHCTHSITPNQIIYDVTSTSGMTTQPLYQTSHSLYLCLHTDSTVISPTFVWHHTNILCDIIWTVYNFTPNPCVITVLYLWNHRLYIWKHNQHEGNIYFNMWHHSHYLVHHPHCIGNITPKLFTTSDSKYVWHRVHYKRHHILTFWPQTTIWVHHSHYIRHRVCCIWVITASV